MEIIGKSIPRVDAVEKIRGRALFVDDLKIDGMIYAGVVRSMEPHLLIKEVRIKNGKRNKKYLGMFTAKDIPGENIVPLVLRDWPFLAEKVAKFYGDPVALVAGENRDAVDEMLDRVEVVGEPIEGVFSPIEAMESDRVKVYGEDNIFKRFVIDKGDTEKGFADSDIIVEGEFETGHQVHSYLEPQGMIAIPEPDGCMTIFGSMQCPFYVRDAVSSILSIPLSKVRVIQMTTGGAFGGKEDVPSQVAGQAALVAFRLKRPVKLVYSRREDFLSMSKRHPSVVKVKYGARKNGKLLACQIKFILNAGAYATLSPIVLWRGTVHAMGPYHIPNVKVESYAVATNLVPCGAFRGFGQPQVAFAQESTIDMLSERLGISPARLRMINRLDKGRYTGSGQEIRGGCGMAEVLQKTCRAADFEKKWRDRGSRKNRDFAYGIGLSTTFYGVGLGAGGAHLDKAGAYIQVEKDGSVSVYIGNIEMGQGALTILSQITAQAMGCKVERITIQKVDTTTVPDSGPTVASRTTIMSGNAILNACNGIVQRMIGVAEEILGRKVQGRVWSDHAEDIRKGILSYEEVIRECHRRRIKMSESGWVKVEGTSFNEKGQGSPYKVYTYSTNIAEVEVDLSTGEVRVIHFYSGHDVGRAINPVLLAGQIEGGVLKGVGYSLMEELIFENGKMMNPSFLDYTIPTSMDMVKIHPIIHEDPYEEGPFGAKGIGEPPFIGVAPAIANAIHDATGLRFHRLPIKPEQILKRLMNKEGK